MPVEKTVFRLKAAHVRYWSLLCTCACFMLWESMMGSIAKVFKQGQQLKPWQNHICYNPKKRCCSSSCVHTCRWHRYSRGLLNLMHATTHGLPLFLATAAKQGNLWWSPQNDHRASDLTCHELLKALPRPCHDQAMLLSCWMSVCHLHVGML